MSFPQRLSSQLIVVVTLATIAAALLLSFLFNFGVRQYERRIILDVTIERLSSLPQFTNNSSSNEWLQPRRMHRRSFDYALDSKPSISLQDMSPEDKEYAANIAQELNLDQQELRFRLLETPLSQQIEASDWGHSMRQGRKRYFPSRTTILVSLKYDGTTWVNVQIIRPLRFNHTARRPPYLLGTVLAVGGLFILLGILLTIRNITKPMRALAEAAEKIGVGETVPPLESKGPKEIRDTIAAFNGMYARLNAFIEDRTGMLAAISHDLRTPLTALRLRAEMLDDSEEKEAIQRIVSTMVEMVEATLDFSRDDVTREETRAVDIAALVSGVVGDFQDMGYNLTLVTSFPDHAVSSCRPIAMTRAVTNLIRNAVHYGKTVTVNLEMHPDTLSIIVEDDGPGIPEVKMQDVFKPFVRLDQARDTSSGSGLGLSIVQSIARAHGGHVTLANRSEGGLRAEIILPVIKPPSKS